MRTAWFVTIWWLVVGAPLTVNAVTYIEGGRTAYRIVIPAAPQPAESYAAKELQLYLARISGVALPIVNDTELAGGKEIWLGDTGRLRALLTVKTGKPPFELVRPGSDGFMLRNVGNHLVIAGGTPRGTLYGVYGLLEKLGVRWYAPEIEVVPAQTRVALPALAEVQMPAFDYRELSWYAVLRRPEFAARLRLNGQGPGLTAQFGGPLDIGFPFAHSLDLLIPPESFHEHPEYFPLLHDRREGGFTQRCFSNFDVTMQGIRRVRAWLAERPELTIVNVSQNATDGWCRCPRCNALNDAEGSPAASLLNFVNAIAADIAVEHPAVRVETLATGYTRTPPATLRPAPNVIICLPTDGMCCGHPLETCTSAGSRRFRADLNAWTAVAPAVYIEDYGGHPDRFLQPFPNLDAIQANMQYYARLGVKGIFFHGNSWRGGDLEALRVYLLAKLLWNPRADVPRMTREFLRAYYGMAGPAMDEYLTAMQAPVEGMPAHVSIVDPPTAPYLSDDVLRRASESLDLAEKLADNEEIHRRVQGARLPIWYITLVTGRVAGEARDVLLRRFLDVAHQAGVTMISEDEDLDHWAQRMGAEQ